MIIKTIPSTTESICPAFVGLNSRDTRTARVTEGRIRVPIYLLVDDGIADSVRGFRGSFPAVDSQTTGFSPAEMYAYNSPCANGEIRDDEWLYCALTDFVIDWIEWSLCNKHLRMRVSVSSYSKKKIAKDLFKLIKNLDKIMCPITEIVDCCCLVNEWHF